jgi:hypothetical protein
VAEGTLPGEGGKPGQKVKLLQVATADGLQVLIPLEEENAAQIGAALQGNKIVTASAVPDAGGGAG